MLLHEDRMHFQYVVAPPNMVPPMPPPGDVPNPSAELLRELIDVQREQLAYLRASHEAQHSNARWQAFLNRWKEDYPGVGTECLKALPTLERAFLRLLEDLTQRVNDPDNDSIEDDFSLSEFLDRYGMRVSQLGAMLNALGPIADAARTAPE
jgi:hypothetical protein